MFKKIGLGLFLVLMLSVSALSAQTSAPVSAKNSANKDAIAIQAALLAKDQTSIGGNLSVEENTTVRTAVVVGGDLTVSGTILKDAVSVGGSIILKKTASVGGDVTAVGGTIVKEEGAVVNGKEVQVVAPMVVRVTKFLTNPGVASVIAIVIPIAVWISVLALLLLVAAFFTRNIGLASYTMEKFPLKSFGWAVVGMIVSLPLMVALILTIIGIPLVFLVLFLYTIAFVMGATAACQLTGKRFLTLLRKNNQPMLWEVTWGYLLLWAVSIVPIVGEFVRVLMVFIGFGAIIKTRFGLFSKA